jgi:hypothetical protein
MLPYLIRPEAEADLNEIYRILSASLIGPR